MCGEDWDDFGDANLNTYPRGADVSLLVTIAYLRYAIQLYTVVPGHSESKAIETTCDASQFTGLVVYSAIVRE